MKTYTMKEGVNVAQQAKQDILRYLHRFEKTVEVIVMLKMSQSTRKSMWTCFGSEMLIPASLPRNSKSKAIVTIIQAIFSLKPSRISQEIHLDVSCTLKPIIYSITSRGQGTAHLTDAPDTRLV